MAEYREELQNPEPAEEQQEFQIPTRQIERNEMWKLQKPHPKWAPEIVSQRERVRLWKLKTADERIYLSDILGARDQRRY